MNANQKLINLLKDDNNYYGDLGRKYLSNSNIQDLLGNPKAYLEQRESTMPMLHGRYLHTAVLEPQKLANFEIIEASTRNTKIYKDARGDQPDHLLLQHEADNLIAMKDEIIRHWDSEIYSDDCEYEVPAIGTICGVEWKGKADILTPTRIIDIKTTADMRKFRRSAHNYNYDSQAYIYQHLFGVPLEFFVIDKTTFQCKIFKCSELFLEGGMEKVAKATAQYDKFFGPNAWEDVNEYIEVEIL